MISLFTNVLLDLVGASFIRKWTYIEKNCTIPRHEFLLVVRFVLNSTYCTFNNTYYEQMFGTMDSPLFPVIINITLQDLKVKVIEILKFNLFSYFRYVTLMVVPSMPDFTLNTFNSFHPRLLTKINSLLRIH